MRDTRRVVTFGGGQIITKRKEVCRNMDSAFIGQFLGAKEKNKNKHIYGCGPCFTAANSSLATQVSITTQSIIIKKEKVWSN